MDEFKIQLPTVVQSHIIHDGFVKIRRDKLRLNNNQNYQYDTLITKSDAAVVIGMTSDNLYVLTREYRHPTGKILLSCAGGYLDGNEDPCKAAQRELLEETGFNAEKFQLIGTAYPYPGISGQKIYYVAAINAFKQSESTPETSEIVQTILMSKNQLHKAINDNVPIDGNLCTALFFLNQTL